MSNGELIDIEPRIEEDGSVIMVFHFIGRPDLLIGKGNEVSGRDHRLPDGRIQRTIRVLSRDATRMDTATYTVGGDGG